MRILLSLYFVLSLVFSLKSQSDKPDLSLDLEPGTIYTLHIQTQYNRFTFPNTTAGPKESNRFSEKYNQNSQLYELKVLTREGDQYEVELARNLIQSLGLTGGPRKGQTNYTPWLKRAVLVRDSVRYKMDKFGNVIDLALPDSTLTGYAVPDTFRIQKEAVMPSMISELTNLLHYLHPDKMVQEAPFASSSQQQFTFLGKQGELLHLRSSSNMDLYLDPETKWISFMKLDEVIEGPRGAPPGYIHVLARGRISSDPKLARISGTAPLHKNGSFLLRITPYFQGTDAQHLIHVDENGRFAWQDTIDEPFFFQLTDLYGTDFWGYAQPGGDLVLDLPEAGEWKVQGKTAEHCRYLNTFFETFPMFRHLLTIGMERALNKYFDRDLDHFWQLQLQEHEKAKKQLADWTDRLDPEFAALQYRQIDYFRAGALDLNLSSDVVRRAMTDTLVDAAPAYYLAYLDDLVLYNDVNRDLPAFRALLHLDLQRRLFSSITGDIINILQRSYESAYYFAQLQYEQYPLWQTTADLLNSAIQWQEGADAIDHLYNHFQGVYGGAMEASRPLEAVYRQMQALQRPGNKLPDLTVHNSLGLKISLSDYVGKPTVLVIINGDNYWEQILPLEETHKQFSGVQFVLLHIGPDGKDAGQGLVDASNVHHLYARTNSAAAASAFLQYSPGRHRRAYLLDRTGKIAGTLSGSEYLNDILEQLEDLQAGSPFLDKQSRRGLMLILLGLLAGGLIFGLITHHWQKRLRKREYNRRQLVEAQLQAIRSQLNPHFMFNSMGSIQHLIRSGQADQAQAYLGKLASLLRASLRHTREAFISLQEELDVVLQYCELEALRFNFSYDLQVDQQLDTRAISIPPLLLQPYVENAVLHGIAPLRGQGRLQVFISGQDHRLWISIRDNGPGMESSRAGLHQGNGLGLELNAERLRLVYGNAAQVRIFSASETGAAGSRCGTEIEIAMPME